MIRARARGWPAWLALGRSSLLLVAGAWFDFVAARVPDTPTTLRVGERPPDFTLPDVAGRLTIPPSLLLRADHVIE